MGHPSDWDEIRHALEERYLENSVATHLDTCAIPLRPAQDWQASLRQLAELIPAESVLVGYSMGARLALGLGLEYPDRFRGLVFISGNPGLESDVAREGRLVTDGQVAARIESQPLAEFLTEWYQQAVFSTVPEAITRSEIAHKLERDSNYWPAILRANSIAHQPNYWTYLDRLQTPMLAIAGKQDTKYCQIAVRLAHELPSKVTSKIIANCGHIVHREQPEALVEALADFLKRLETS
jgi:2-succinyl-6-hydroxy-2,4-cyclohexadiene-1-carboxylate synthase